MSLDANDPRLTAYVLGELSAEEHAEVAAALADSPAWERAVAAVRTPADLPAPGHTSHRSSGHADAHPDTCRHGNPGSNIDPYASNTYQNARVANRNSLTHRHRHAYPNAYTYSGATR